MGTFNIATALLYLDKFKEAIKYYDKVQYHDDELYCVHSQYYKGICLMKLYEFDAAIICIKNILNKFDNKLLKSKIGISLEGLRN
jgi:tetratricopeptide (TPR) repeat protein